jgi:hypothetical protein
MSELLATELTAIRSLPSMEPNLVKCNLQYYSECRRKPTTINWNSPLMKNKACLTGQLFTTDRALKRLGPIVRIQVRHQSGFETERFVTNRALLRQNWVIRKIAIECTLNKENTL